MDREFLELGHSYKLKIKPKSYTLKFKTYHPTVLVLIVALSFPFR